MLRDAKRLGRYLLGGALLGASLGYLGRHEIDPLLLLMSALGIIYLSPLVLLVCVRTSFALNVLCLGAALLVGLICATSVIIPAEAADKKAAMAYVDTIKPTLEDFRSKHGHYPDRLAEVAAPTAPSGLVYKREPDSLPTNPDHYRINMDGFEYNSGTATWFDDD